MYICIESTLNHTMNLANIIRERRVELNISQSDLAQMADVGIATVKDIEARKTIAVQRKINNHSNGGKTLQTKALLTSLPNSFIYLALSIEQWQSYFQNYAG